MLSSFELNVNGQYYAAHSYIASEWVAIVFEKVLSWLTDDGVYFIRLLGDRIINLLNYRPLAISSVVVSAVTRDTSVPF